METSLLILLYSIAFKNKPCKRPMCRLPFQLYSSAKVLKRIQVDSMHADCQIAGCVMHFDIKSLVFKLDNTTGI
jgi:hypothetical protein